MDYDYNKLFADTYGFTHEKNLNAFDRSYDPDDFSDYEEYDTDIDEDFSDNEIEVSLPEIVPATIKNDEIQPSELELKFNKLNQVVFDNEFQHLEDPLFLTSSEKKQVLPLLSKIEGTQDSVEVYQALVPESRGHLAYNQQVTEFVSDVIKTHYPPAVAQNFSLHLKEFFEIERYEDDHNHFLNERFKLMDSIKDPEVLEILRFDEDQVPYHQNFNVYIPTKDARQDFVFRHTSEFRIIEEFEFTLEHRESYEKIMSLARSLGNFQFELESIWFRYQFSKLESNVLAKSVLLVSHPMMIPQHFRQQFNELIILPEDFYFHEKSESFRFFELMFVRKKHKIFLPSRRIQLYVLKFFKVYFSSDKLRFVKKLPPIIRRLNIMDIYHPTSNVIENLTRADFGIPHVLLAKEQIVTGIIHSTTMPPINSRRYKIVSNPFSLKRIGNRWNPRSFYRFKFH